MMGSPELVMLGKLSLSALLGGLIGLEREMHSQAAGLRTHMVLAIGSCLVMLVSIHLWESQGEPRTGDPGRVAAHVVAGIGFLGAGAIMRFGASVRGLTTAACLWTAAGIGLAVGVGYWSAAVAATGLTILSIFVFDKVEKAFITGKAHRRFTVHAKDTPGLVGRIEGVLETAEISIKSIQIQRDLVEGKVQVTLMATWQDKADVDALSRGISAFKEVERVDID